MTEQYEALETEYRQSEIEASNLEEANWNE